MTTIENFIDGIHGLADHQKDVLKATVEDAQFGARLDHICKPVHLRALQDRLSGLSFTDVQQHVVKDAIAGMLSGMSQGAFAYMFSGEQCDYRMLVSDVM